MSPYRRLLSFLFAVLAMLVLLVVAGHWWSIACFPSEVHTFKWQCELGLPALGLSFAVPALLYGFAAARSPWLEGFAVSLVASLAAGSLSYFQPFFSGASMLTNATATLYYAVLPGLQGALAGFRLQSNARKAAA